MNSFINYLIETNLSICFFLLIYKILLSKETDHRFNRAYLLIALMISMALPLLHVQVPSFLAFENTLPTYWLPEIQITPAKGDAVIQLSSFWFWATPIYALGASLFFLVFLIRLLRIVKAVYQSPMIRNGSVWLIELQDDREVFSFFKFILISKSLQLSELEKKQIIRHEQVHIDNYHSFDILFVNLLGVLFWFNPFIKTYRKSFVQLHEFEADARSVENDEVDSYCSLLAKAALNSSGYQLANHFTNSLTLKRIEMMKTMKRKISGRKIFFLAGIVSTFCYLVVGNDIAFAQIKTSQKDDPDDKIYSFVEEAPSFGKKENNAELYEFIAKNLRYPEEAKKKGIEGKVFSKFVVEKDGSVTNVEIVKGVGYGMDEETLRVMKMSPNWNPGTQDGKPLRVSYVMPILFKLTK